MGAPRSWRDVVRLLSHFLSLAMIYVITMRSLQRSSNCSCNAHAVERVTWSGRHRASLQDLGVYPRPYQAQLPIWVAVGGTPESVVRAATLGLPLALAIIGGMPERFAPLVHLYRETAQRAGHDPAKLPVSINSHGFIADDSRQAADTYYPSATVLMNKIGRERGWSPATRQQLETGRTLPRGRLRRQSGRDHREDPVPTRIVRPSTAPAATGFGHPAPCQADARRRIVGERKLRLWSAKRSRSVLSLDLPGCVGVLRWGLRKRGHPAIIGTHRPSLL